MGKGNDPNCAAGAAVSRSGMLLADHGTAEPELPLDWNTRKLNYRYLTTREELEACVEALRHPEVVRVGLDIETTGGLKPWYGSIRLIQVAVELPQPRQFLIDCWQVDPSPVFPTLADPQVQVITCNGVYEQTHLYYRYGVVLTNLWDVSYASQEIVKVKAARTRERAKQLISRRVSPIKEQLKDARTQLRAARKRDEAEAVRWEEQVRRLEEQLAETEREAKEQAPKPRKPSSNFRLLMRRVVGKKISKAQQTSPWDSPQLTHDQLRYAAMDAAGLLDIARGLTPEIAALDLEARVAEANRRVLDRSLRELQAGDPRPAEFAQLARTMLTAPTLAQLEHMMRLQGQATLHHTYRDALQRVYELRRRQLQPA